MRSHSAPLMWLYRRMLQIPPWPDKQDKENQGADDEIWNQSAPRLVILEELVRVGLAEGRTIGRLGDLANIGPTTKKNKKRKDDVSILLKFFSETKITQHHRSGYL